MQGFQRGKIDDDALTARAREGDGIAFSTLVERHYARVVLVAEGVAGSLPLAEICAQEAFARACGRLSQLHGASDFRALVYRTALARALVRAPLGGLSRRLVPAQAALLLREQGNFTYAEIARCLKISATSAQRLLRRGRGLALEALALEDTPLHASAWRQG